MTEEHRPATAFWTDLRRQPTFQTAVVFGGGSWLVLQAADVFGVETASVRWLGAAMVLVFLGLLGAAGLAVLRQRRSGAAPARGGLRPRSVVIAAAALLLLGTGAWAVRPFVFASAVRPGADVIAVLPFQSSGAGVELLGEGLVDLLSTNLDEVGPIRTVNPRTTLHHYRQQAVNGSVDLDGALRVGRSVGAGSVLLGSVVSTGSAVRVTADLYSVESGRVIARAARDGASDNVLGLVDELSIELMRDIWRSREPLPELRVSAITTPSVGAIRAYMRGEQFYRRVQWDSAAVAFEEAIAHDSTFALAHFRLGETYGWREALGSEQARRHSDAAARFADRLPARERALVVAHRLHEFGNIAAVDSFQAYVQRYPDDVAGWYMLADARYHAAIVTGVDIHDLLANFERVHAKDATYPQVYAHLLELALMAGDSARYDRYLAAFRNVVPGEAALYETWRIARWGERGEALRRIMHVAEAAGAQASIVNRIGAAAAVRSYGSTPEPTFLPVVVDSLQRLLGPGAPRMLASTRVVALVSAGRMQAADETLELLRGTEQALGVTLPFIVSGLAPADVFQPERERLRAAAPRRMAAYWRAVQALQQRDAAAADREIAAARADTTSGADVSDAIVDGLAAWLSVVRGDTVAGTKRLRAALLAHGYSPQTALALQPLRQQLGRLQAGLPEFRAEGIRRLELMSFTEPQTLPLFARDLAEAYIADGRPQLAASIYARLAQVWADADAALQPQVRAAREAAQRLVAER